MGVKLHQILTNSFEDYNSKYGTSWTVRSVISRVLKCRTEKLGGYKWVCSCGNEKLVYRSCRSRSCPRCGEYELKKFIDVKMKKVFPGDHFHLIFTIPSELNPLWLKNTRVMGNILFSSVKKTILRFTEDQKYMGARPGIMMALHTWGQNLSLHPHIHALVTAGGLTKTKELKYCRENYLFPAKAAMKYFRFVFLNQVKKKFGSYPIIDKCYKTNWNVFIKEKYSGGRGVLLYLSRYIRGLPIKDSRIKRFDRNYVSFSYKDYRDGKKKEMTLTIKDFMQRLLLHIPPKNFRTYRESGLYFSDKIEELKAILNNRLLPRNSDIDTVTKKYFPEIKDKPIYQLEICSKCKKLFDELIIIPVEGARIRGSPPKAA